MNTLKTMIGLLVIITALTSAALAIEVGKPAPSFSLKDQFGKTTQLSDLKGRVAVLVVSTRNSGELMGPWVDGIGNRYAGRNDTFRVLPMVDLHSIPRLFRGIATNRIKKETKDPVLIDFDGKTAKAYEASDKYPVVVVIDGEGVVRDIRKTKLDKESFDAVVSAVDKALKDIKVSPQP